jgi:hypothetical protein
LGGVIAICRSKFRSKFHHFQGHFLVLCSHLGTHGEAFYFFKLCCSFFFFSFFLWRYLGLNSGPPACYTGILPLEAHLQAPHWISLFGRLLFSFERWHAFI